MAEVAFWERRFVEEYIMPEKRDRYLTKLKGPKHRAEILDRLNHALDYRPDTATRLSEPQRTSGGLAELLHRLDVADTCYIMADASSVDGLELRIERAIDELLGHAFAFIMICPPVPIAIYKQEDIGGMFLLQPPRANQAMSRLEGEPVASDAAENTRAWRAA